jgi:hypothetical protein
MKSLNLVSDIKQASTGVPPNIIRKRAAKSSSLHDLDDIVAGCRLGCVEKNYEKNLHMEFFTCKHLRTAEKNLDKLCKGNLPELHIPYYKRFQVDFLTQICDKT